MARGSSAETAVSRMMRAGLRRMTADLRSAVDSISGCTASSVVTICNPQFSAQPDCQGSDKSLNSKLEISINELHVCTRHVIEAQGNAQNHRGLRRRRQPIPPVGD